MVDNFRFKRLFKRLFNKLFNCIKIRNLKHLKKYQMLMIYYQIRRQRVNMMNIEQLKKQLKKAMMIIWALMLQLMIPLMIWKSIRNG